ncbi:MAG: hypothetical protein D4R97_09005 [Bacteroidetes bacterium]|nr:MAG: hypothetical protein D4R97_09005 [Bacteroidota bacterium]
MNRNKLFFKKLCVFIILVLAVNTLLNAVYDHSMYYFRLSRIQDEQFKAHPDTLKYLMLGNSHNRVNPEILGNGFCYIMPKEIYTQTYYKLKYILEKTNKKTENILLSIDPVNFSPRAEKELSFDGYWRKYLDYFELARESHDPGYLLNWLTGNFFSYVGNYRYVFMSVQFFKADLSQIKNGYIPARNYRNFAKEPDREALGFELATAYLASYSKKSTLGETKYYQKILALCQQYNIHLILLRMPMTDEYLKYARKMVDLDKLDREIIDLTRNHCDDFRVFDFRNEFHGKPEYFFNADHVNPAGVNIISMKIKEELGKIRNFEKPNDGAFKPY